MDQTSVDHKVDKALIGLASQTQVLFICGLTALVVGLSMMFTGIPADVEQHWGPESRMVIGIPLLIAGQAILAGSFVANEKRWAWYAAVVGFVIWSLWSLGMALAYAWIVAERGVDWAWPWQEISPETGRLYITFLYQGIAALTIMHVITLVRLGRPPVG